MYDRIPIMYEKKGNKYWWILTLVIGLFIGGAVFAKEILSTSRSTILFHGPHISSSVFKSGIDESNVLAARTNRYYGRYQRPASPTPFRSRTPTPRVTKTPTTSPSVKPGTIPTGSVTGTITPTPIPGGLNSNKFGIAAGGSLPSLSAPDLDTYFSQLKALGVSWVRYDFDWDQIQSNGSTTFDWTGTDRISQAATKYGIQTLGIITYTPTWAQQSSCKGTFGCAPANPAAFGTFAGAVAARYAPKGIHDWEIWNEPNVSVFWRPAPNVSAYTAILKSAYSEIKKADPASFVITAGLSPAADEGSNIAPITFIKTLYSLDPAKDFDAIALHPYSYPVIASYDASWNSWEQMSDIRTIMNNSGDSQKQIWITEYGAPTGGPGTAQSTTQLNFDYGSDYMTEDAQTIMMRDALSEYSLMPGTTGVFFWYSLHDLSTNKSTPENFFGLTRSDWSKKPAYNLFHSAIVAAQ
jgi:polysaccharide biosynthesis protein PslG